MPADYDNGLGRPTSLADREYQTRRGSGDGRVVDGVRPRSLGLQDARGTGVYGGSGAEPRYLGASYETLDLGEAATVPGASSGAPPEHGYRVAEFPDDAAEPRSAAIPTIDVRALTAASVILICVSVLMQPLVFAHVNGFTVIGMDLPARASRAAGVAVAQGWTDSMSTGRELAFMIGEYVDGARVATVPLEFAPAPTAVCRSAADRARLLSQGATFVWCTLAALASSPCGDVAARAMIGVDTFIRPVEALADSGLGSASTTFRFGATSQTSVVRRPLLSAEHGPPGWRAHAIIEESHQVLRTALHAARDDPLLDGWKERMGRLSEEIPPGLLSALPDFTASDGIEQLPFSPTYVPIATRWLPRAPQQAPAPDGAPACIRSPLDMLTAVARRRLTDWMHKTALDLAGIRDALEADPTAEAPRDRPPAIAIGQCEMHEWARGRVWDCRGACCVVADFEAPIDTHLNLEYLRQRLSDDPDQYLVANLLEGVRLDADVELQTVLVPHLASLPKGFASVAQEIRRLHDLSWYGFFNSTPFWPMYYNGQGAVARKLEKDRYRRSTEGGGPRKPTFDACGVQAISINSASHVHHMPRHFVEDHRPEFRAWIAARGLGATAGPPLQPAHA